MEERILSEIPDELHTKANVHKQLVDASGKVISLHADLLLFLLCMYCHGVVEVVEEWQQKKCGLCRLIIIGLVIVSRVAAKVKGVGFVCV